MFVDRLVRLILPRQDVFFNLFNDLGAKISAASDLYIAVCDAEDTSQQERLAVDFRALEHDADEIAHQIYAALDKTFVTPIDREDLAALTSALDNIIDGMEHAVAFLILYQLPKLTPAMQALLRIGAAAAREVVGAIGVLRHFGNPAKMQPFVVNVNSLENEGDQAFRNALAGLFAGDITGKDLVRQRDLLNAFEEVIDRCEDAIDVIRSVVVKNG
jgi:predicted phosphate transport protein (TIGR00153 family)